LRKREFVGPLIDKPVLGNAAAAPVEELPLIFM